MQFLFKIVFPCIDKQLNCAAQSRWRVNNTCHFDVLNSRWPHTIALGITIMKNCSDLNNIKENANVPIRKGNRRANKRNAATNVDGQLTQKRSKMLSKSRMKQLSDEYYALSLELLPKWANNKPNVRKYCWNWEREFGNKSEIQENKQINASRTSHIPTDKLDPKNGEKSNFLLFMEGVKFCPSNCDGEAQS